MTNAGEWVPASFSDFLIEVAQVKTHCISLDHLALYRGHARADWRLDSTFARFVKNQIPDTLKGDDSYRHSLEYHRHLGNLFLRKFGTIVVPSEELKRAAEEHIGIDPWFELMKRMQQYEEDDLAPNLRGTFLLDWTQDWRIALFFANHKRQPDDVGAVYIADITQTGPVLHDNLGVILDKFRKEFQKNEHVGCPLVFHPKCQITCQRTNNQDAVYIAQMDLRIDLAEHWAMMDEERKDGSSILLRILLPKGTKQEVDNWLTQEGITERYVYPDKKSGSDTGQI